MYHFLSELFHNPFLLYLDFPSGGGISLSLQDIPDKALRPLNLIINLWKFAHHRKIAAVFADLHKHSISRSALLRIKEKGSMAPEVSFFALTLFALRG